MSAGGRAYRSSLRMKAKLAGAPAVVALLSITVICSGQTQPRDSGKRRTAYPRIQNAHFYRAKRGLPKAERRPFAAMSAMRNAALNICHGNRAPVGVRGRESRPQGEGEQFVCQHKKKKGV